MAKGNIAKENKLNYVEFWNIIDIEKYFDTASTGVNIRWYQYDKESNDDEDKPVKKTKKGDK